MTLFPVYTIPSEKDENESPSSSGELTLYSSFSSLVSPAESTKTLSAHSDSSSLSTTGTAVSTLPSHSLSADTTTHHSQPESYNTDFELSSGAHHSDNTPFKSSYKTDFESLSDANHSANTPSKSGIISPLSLNASKFETFSSKFESESSTSAGYDSDFEASTSSPGDYKSDFESASTKDYSRNLLTNSSVSADGYSSDFEDSSQQADSSQSQNRRKGDTSQSLSREEIHTSLSERRKRSDSNQPQSRRNSYTSFSYSQSEGNWQDDSSLSERNRWLQGDSGQSEDYSSDFDKSTDGSIEGSAQLLQRELAFVEAANKALMSNDCSNRKAALEGLYLRHEYL